MPGQEKATSDYKYPSDAARTADINFIMETTGAENGAYFLDLSDSALRKAYEKVAKDAEGGSYDRNMGGVVHDTYQELGYMHGGVHKGKTNPKSIKYAKGGAVRGKRFSGSY